MRKNLKKNQETWYNKRRCMEYVYVDSLESTESCHDDDIMCTEGKRSILGAWEATCVIEYDRGTLVLSEENNIPRKKDKSESYRENENLLKEFMKHVFQEECRKMKLSNEYEQKCCKK